MLRAALLFPTLCLAGREACGGDLPHGLPLNSNLEPTLNEAALNVEIRQL